MTAAEFLEDDNTLDVSRLEELHALLDEFHQEQGAAKPVAVTEWPPAKLRYAPAIVCKSYCLEGAGTL